jgi:hypothetical protein
MVNMFTGNLPRKLKNMRSALFEQYGKLLECGIKNFGFEHKEDKTITEDVIWNLNTTSFLG